MTKAFLIKYAEIGIKGKNRHYFEDRLVHHIVRSLRDVDGQFSVTKEYGRIYVFPEGEFDYDGVLAALQCVFGISGICPVTVIEDMDFENVKKETVRFM